MFERHLINLYVCMCVCMCIYLDQTQNAIRVDISSGIMPISQSHFHESKDCNWTQIYVRLNL